MGFKVRLPLIEHFVENCNNFIETGNIPAFKDVRHKGLERREGSPNAPGPGVQVGAPRRLLGSTCRAHLRACVQLWEISATFLRGQPGRKHTGNTRNRWAPPELTVKPADRAGNGATGSSGQLQSH